MTELRLSETAERELNQLVDQVEQVLLDLANVNYFELMPGHPHKDQLSGSNAETLRSVPAKPGVYAIWVQDGSTPALRYIGHTAGKTAQTRLTNHFFKKHPRTGSQLSKVEDAFTSGHKVGFTYVALHPPLIRLYVESTLIARHQELCIWNIQGKAAKQKITIAGSRIESP